MPNWANHSLSGPCISFFNSKILHQEYSIVLIPKHYTEVTRSVEKCWSTACPISHYSVLSTCSEHCSVFIPWWFFIIHWAKTQLPNFLKFTEISSSCPNLPSLVHVSIIRSPWNSNMDLTDTEGGHSLTIVFHLPLSWRQGERPMAAAPISTMWFGVSYCLLKLKNFKAPLRIFIHMLK